MLCSRKDAPFETEFFYKAGRKQCFKKGVNQEESRRRRSDSTVQIRKEKKEDHINKRRGTLFTNVRTKLLNVILGCLHHQVLTN